MPTTDHYGFVTPAYGETPDGPAFFQEFADSIDDAIYAEEQARVAAIAALGAPYVDVRRTTAQSMAASTEVPIVWEQAVSDMAGFWSGSGSDLVVPAGMGGLYIMIGSYSYALTASGGSRISIFKVAGATIQQWAHPVTTSQPITGTIMHITPLTAGQTVQLRHYQSSGAALNNHTQPPPRLVLARLRP